MSLKAFHIVFIIVSSLFTLGFGVWSIREYQAVGGAMNLVLALSSFAGFLLLLVYFRWFLRKMKNESYL